LEIYEEQFMVIGNLTWKIYEWIYSSTAKRTSVCYDYMACRWATYLSQEWMRTKGPVQIALKEWKVNGSETLFHMWQWRLSCWNLVLYKFRNKFIFYCSSTFTDLHFTSFFKIKIYIRLKCLKAYEEMTLVKKSPSFLKVPIV
jgi:hypothetical protein